MMFTFFRTRSGPAEFWDVLLVEGAVSDATDRFGPPLMYRGADPGDLRFHEIGKLVAVVTDDDAEFLLACKELTEAEQRALDQQLELLLGQTVWAFGAEPNPREAFSFTTA